MPRRRRARNARPPAPVPVLQLRTEADVAAVVGRLLDPARTRPVVVLSVAARQPRPLIDPAVLAESLGGQADVVVLPHRLAWTMSGLLPTGAGVYGGAARVYGPAESWAEDVRAAKLFLLQQPSDAEGVLGAIVDRVRGPAAEGSAHPSPAQAHLPSEGPPGVRRAASPQDVEALAATLLDPARTRPVVVLSTAVGAEGPALDPETVHDALGDLAQVWVLEAGRVSWDLAGRLPPSTEVFGGAARTYPPDRVWFTDVRHSPLRLVLPTTDVVRLTETVVADALRAAGGAGFGTSPEDVPAEATVLGLVSGERALVDLEAGGQATIWRELGVPGVPLERLVRPGQRLHGVLDLRSRRLDIRPALSDPREAGADLRPGDVVPAQVTDVDAEGVTVCIHPAWPLRIPAELTDAEGMSPVDLFAPGDVVAVSLWDDDGELAARRDTLDPDVTPRPALRLLPDGPPWLDLPTPTAPAPAEEPAPPESQTPAAPEEGGPEVPPAPSVPSPPPEPVGGAAAPGADTAGERERMANRIEELRRTNAVLAAELDAAEVRAAQVARRLRDVQSRYREAGAARRRAERRARAAEGPSIEDRLADLFIDPEQQLRFEVEVAWARRVPAADKPAWPLAAYTLGPDFLDSVERLEGVERAKVLEVVVDVLTGRAKDIAGRDLHPLRAAGTAQIIRADGAAGWRVALQQGTPGARRLHYWKLRDGTIELSRIGHHDDFAI